MDAFVSRKKRKLSHDVTIGAETSSLTEDDTDTKLAVLASLHPSLDQSILFEALISSEGSVEKASSNLAIYGAQPDDKRKTSSPRKGVGHQSSLAAYRIPGTASSAASRAPLTKKGRTLHLYAPEDVAAHSPCSIIHNFLPAQDAERLLRELLDEAKTFERQAFRIFDNVVQSPHTACFYVASDAERRRQRTEYLYNGSRLTDVRELTPEMRAVSGRVRDAVNREIATRITTHGPSGRKLKHQSPDEWLPNAAFVNCYAGGAESVGYHTDQLTYLGPRAVIGSISLGVARQFRVRKIVARDDEEGRAGRSRADEEGQIAIHLPHNSLLVMHADCQEEWKHSIAPAQSIDPHPVSGNKRINITYRCYKDTFHPK